MGKGSSLFKVRPDLTLALKSELRLCLFLVAETSCTFFPADRKPANREKASTPVLLPDKLAYSVQRSNPLSLVSSKHLGRAPTYSYVLKEPHGFSGGGGVLWPCPLLT